MAADRGRGGRALRVAAAIIVATALAGWVVAQLRAGQAERIAFRDEVIGVIGERFSRSAVAVAGDPDAIEIEGKRRDVRALYASAGQLPEPERRQAIYRQFLGDSATMNRAVVREEPFAQTQASAEATKMPLDAFASPKRVKTLRVRPDGTMSAPAR